MKEICYESSIRIHGSGLVDGVVVIRVVQVCCGMSIQSLTSWFGDVGKEIEFETGGCNAGVDGKDSGILISGLVLIVCGIGIDIGRC